MSVRRLSITLLVTLAALSAQDVSASQIVEIVELPVQVIQQVPQIQQVVQLESLPIRQQIQILQEQGIPIDIQRQIQIIQQQQRQEEIRVLQQTGQVIVQQRPQPPRPIAVGTKPSASINKPKIVLAPERATGVKQGGEATKSNQPPAKNLPAKPVEPIKSEQVNPNAPPKSLPTPESTKAIAEPGIKAAVEKGTLNGAAKGAANEKTGSIETKTTGTTEIKAAGTTESKAGTTEGKPAGNAETKATGIEGSTKSDESVEKGASKKAVISSESSVGEKTMGTQVEGAGGEGVPKPTKTIASGEEKASETAATKIAEETTGAKKTSTVSAGEGKDAKQESGKGAATTSENTETSKGVGKSSAAENANTGVKEEKTSTGSKEPPREKPVIASKETGSMESGTVEGNPSTEVKATVEKPSTGTTEGKEPGSAETRVLEEKPKDSNTTEKNSSLPPLPEPITKPDTSAETSTSSKELPPPLPQPIVTKPKPIPANGDNAGTVLKEAAASPAKEKSIEKGVESGAGIEKGVQNGVGIEKGLENGAGIVNGSVTTESEGITRTTGKVTKAVKPAKAETDEKSAAEKPASGVNTDANSVVAKGINAPPAIYLNGGVKESTPKGPTGERR